MAPETNIRFIGQTAPHFAYVLASLLGVVLDVFALFSLIMIALSVFLITVTLMLPLFDVLLSVVGQPILTGDQNFLRDLRDLNGGNLLRILILFPAVLLVLLRERLARPLRTRRGLIFVILFSLPAAIVTIDIVAFSFDIYDYEGTSGAYWLLQANAAVIGTADPASLRSVSISMLTIPLLLSGFLYLPYALIYLIWRKRIGPITGFNKTEGYKRSRPLGAYLLAFLGQSNTRKGLGLILFACIYGSLTLSLTAVPSPGVFQKWSVDMAMALPQHMASERTIIVGLLNFAFWPVFLTLGVFAIYIWKMRPRLFKLLAFGSILPGLISLIYLIPSVRSDESAIFLKPALFFASIWIIPLVGMLHGGYHRLLTGAGLARNAVIKQSLKGQPRILLLRCFALDQALIKRSGHISGILDVFQFFLVRLEEVIVREAYLTAPVLAVANPAEKNEPLGALREYLSDDEWQPFVSNQITESQAIIFILGRGNYTGWETQKIIESGALGRVAFIVPPNPQPALDYLAQNPTVLTALGGEPAIRAINSGRIRGFVTGGDATTMIVNTFKSEMAYQLAIRRMLQAIQA